ncbi:MAG: TonB-dependent receptor plug domain-containing protein, partial [Bacteroidota bacterium]
MKRSITFTSFILFLHLSSRLLAQGPGLDHHSTTKATIQGIVRDASTDQPLDYATISLFNPNDDVLVAGAITNVDGTFSLEAKPGLYYAKVEFLAYEPTVINDVRVGPNEQVSLGEIRLSPAAAALDEVIVTAEKSTMQLSLDKRVFNVGKDLSSQGGNAADLLDNVPSIQVDVEGNVSLRGSNAVRILVDGRPSSLIGNGASGLQNLPANLIERIEVVTNPSARYEAEGTGGIINIVLKKDRRKGLNGSFDLSAGVPATYGTAINLNRRSKKFNFFSNLG